MSLKVDLDRKVTFDGSTARYMPGDVVSGSVVLKLEKPLRAGNLIISFKGYAYTGWTEWMEKRKTYPVENSLIFMVTIPSCETLVSFTLTVVTTSSDGSKKPRLPPGEHRFPFRFRLPDRCPPSLKGKYGRVAYGITVDTDRQSPFTKIDSKKSFEMSTYRNFTVLPFVDLNTIAMATKPIGLIEKRAGRGLFRNRNVIVKVSILKSGFAPGEIIPVFCDVINNSSKPVVKATVKLCKRIYYEAGSKANVRTRTDEEIVAKTEKELLIPRESRSEVQLELTVPPTVPTMDNRLLCSIITIDYYLKIKFTRKSLLNKKIKLRPSVLIGTLPVIVVEPTVPQPPAFEETNIVGLRENKKENDNNVVNECSLSPVCLLLNPIYQEESPDFYY